MYRQPLVTDGAELVQTTDGSRRPSSQNAHCQHKGAKRACRDNDHDHDATKITLVIESYAMNFLQLAQKISGVYSAFKRTFAGLDLHGPKRRSGACSGEPWPLAYGSITRFAVWWWRSCFSMRIQTTEATRH